MDVGLLRRLAQLAPTAFGEGNRLFTEFKGALTENFVLPPRTVAVGVPAKICGKVRPQAAAELEADAAFYRDCAREHAAQPLLPAD